MASAPKRVYRVAVAGPIETFDPVAAETNAELLLVSNLVEPLLFRDPQTGNVLPLAAESYTVSDDGLRIKFLLRADLFWSNGEKVKAEDFVYSLRRLLSASTDAWVADFLTSIKGAEDYHEGAIMLPAQLGIRTDGDRTVIFDLSSPNAFLLDFLTQPATAPVHREMLERHPTNWWRPENWVGSGPFLPAAKGELVHILKKNPHHRWAGRIQLGEVHVHLVASREEGTQMFLDGQVDQFGYRDFSVQRNDFLKFASKKGLVYQPDLSTVFLRVNPRRAPTSQLKLRMALAMAIDRELFAASVGKEGQKAALSILPEGIKSYEAPRGFLFNVPGARKILRDLGYCTKGIALAGCKPPPAFEMVHREGLDVRKIALALAAIWKRELGISVNVTEKLPEEFLHIIKSGEYAVALDDVSVLPERPFGFLDAFRSDGPSRKVFNRLLNSADNAPNWTEAKGNLRRAEALLLGEGEVIPLYYDAIAVAVSPRVKGYTPNIWDQHPFANISISP
ncbi:MAG TPA: peptide ABC transporter substrate-binding protein [Bdellovibrionota bacterium]|nr:peptide ABC transporter substrate-binding protein [Bdellovibrionota bacterium]